jgi:hypothetical protein
MDAADRAAFPSLSIGSPGGGQATQAFFPE